jgi:aspartate/tyrosine/aromatic aminotransferase
MYRAFVSGLQTFAQSICLCTDRHSTPLFCASLSKFESSMYWSMRVGALVANAEHVVPSMPNDTNLLVAA